MVNYVNTNIKTEEDGNVWSIMARMIDGNYVNTNDITKIVQIDGDDEQSLFQITCEIIVDGKLL